MKDYLDTAKELAQLCDEKLDIGNSVDGFKSFYKSLPICIIDAVFSIGIKYSAVIKVVHNYINYYGLKISREKVDEHEHTINDFLTNIGDIGNINTFANKVLKNHNRTSSKNGILKAEACKLVAEVMQKNKINTLKDFNDFSKKEELDAQIKSVKGQSSGIMLKYLYMLAGNDGLVKPDRWIVRFINEVDTTVKETDQNAIQEIMVKTVEILKQKYNYQSLTIRQLDSLIWAYARSNKN